MQYRVTCPCCGETISVELNLFVDPDAPPKGPKPFRYDPEIETMVLDGIEVFHTSYKRMGEILEEKGVLTPTGKKRWFPASVKRLYESAVFHRAANTQES